MKHLKRKLMMTLALLLTAVGGAWAESKPIGLNVEYEAGDEITSTTDVYVYYGEELNTLKKMGVKITSTQPLKIYMITAHSFELNGDAAVYYLPDGESTTGYAGGIPCIGESTGDETVVHVASGSGTLTDPYVFGFGPSGTPVPLTRGTGEKINEWTLTNGMPAGNVTVNVKYFPQAEFAKSTDETLAPTAIANVPANTDAPIVTAGTVANIGASEVKQGTLMYFVSQSTGNTAPDAPDYDDKGWSENVPTADGLAEGKAYVWYYIKGAEPANIADRTDDNTCSDSDIKPLGTTGFVTLAPEPTYDVTFADGVNPEPPAEPEWTAMPNTGVKKGTEVTVTYTGSKKVIGVKAEKKAKAPASTPLDNTTTAWTAGTYVVPAGGLTYSDAITVSGDVTLTLTDGETLTLNKGISLAEGATLTVEGNGTMNINGTDGNTSSTVGGNHGTLVLTSGTLTARGGNGGSVGDWTDGCSGGNGGDAISGTLTINGGSTSVNDGSNGSTGSIECYSSAGTGGKAVAGTVTDNRN